MAATTRNVDLEIAIKATADKAIAGFDKLNKNVEKNKQAIATIGKTASIAFAAVSAGIAFSIKEAINAEEVDRRLDTQLKKLGYTSKELSKNMKQVASAIQDASNYGDEELKGTMTDLLMLTKDYNVALLHTQTAADLAARTNKSLAQATLMLQMAYVGNTSRLKQQGIELKEGIKGMEALNEIQKMVAGGASDNIKPIDQLKNSISDLGESIGGPFVAAAYKYVEGINEGVKSLIAFNERTNGGIGIAAKYTLALTGTVAAIAFIIPKLKAAAEAAKLFQAAIIANPVIATAAAIALLSNALLGLGEKYVDNMNKEKEFKASDEGIIKKFQARIDMYQRQGDALVLVGNQYMKASEAVKVYEKAIEGIENKKKSKKAGEAPDINIPGIGEGGAQLETELKRSLDNMGIATENFTTEQIEKYNNLYTSLDEMDAAITEKKIARLEEANQQQIDMATETAQEVADREAAIGSQRLSAASDLFGNLSSLMNAQTKEQFQVGKAAAVAQALIDTYSGAQAAFSSLAGIPVVGPGLGIAAAAAAVIAGQMRIEQINSAQFNAGGAAQGVFDFRSPGNNENLVTTIGQGESIVPKKFTEAMRSGEASLGGGDTIVNVNINGNTYGITSKDIIDQLTKEVRAGIQSGTIPVGRLTGATS